MRCSWGPCCATPSCCASHHIECLCPTLLAEPALAFIVGMCVQCFNVELTSALSEEEAEKLCW